MRKPLRSPSFDDLSARAQQIIEPSTSRWAIAAAVAFLTAAVFVIYLPALHGAFALDDDILVTDNDLIKSPTGLYDIWFTTTPIDYWPLTNSVFWIEWRIWGENTTGYHVVNLALHVANALLIWLILRHLSIPGAYLAALIFAVHPVNVQSVAWIAQLKNTLSMFFFLLSILWYLKAEADRLPLIDRSGVKSKTPWYWLSLAAFSLAMLSKGSVTILPLLLLLIIWWKRRRVGFRDVRKIIPFFAIGLALTAVNIWFRTHGSDQPFRSATFGQRLAGAGAVVWFYLFKAIAPLDLSFIYPQWQIQIVDWQWWVPMLAVFLVTTLLIWRRGSAWGRASLLAWGFFCVALIPVMGFVDIPFMKQTLVSDHYQYIAIIAPIALMAAGAAYGIARLPSRARFELPGKLLCSMLAISLAVLTFQQSTLYSDPLTLYTATLLKNPGTWRLHNAIGVILHGTEHFDEAIEEYQTALKIEPNYPDVHNNLGLVLSRTGQFDQAIQQYEEAIRLDPKYANAYNNLGNAMFYAGNNLLAIEYFEQALNLKPRFFLAHNGLAAALFKTGRREEAIKHYQQAIEINPEFAEGHANLGNALLEMGRLDGAIEQYDQAVKLKPDYMQAWTNLISACVQTQRPAEAIAAGESAIKLARSTGQDALARQIEQWLTTYRADQSNH